MPLETLEFTNKHLCHTFGINDGINDGINVLYPISWTNCQQKLAGWIAVRSWLDISRRTRGIMKLTKEEKLKYVRQYISGERITTPDGNMYIITLNRTELMGLTNPISLGIVFSDRVADTCVACDQGWFLRELPFFHKKF